MLVDQETVVVQTMRWGLVAGVIVASVYVAPRVVGARAILVFGLLGFVLLLRWPPLGLLALVIASLLVSYGLSTGTETVVNLALVLPPALVVVWIFEALARRGEPYSSEQLPVLSGPVVPLLALCLVAVLAFVNGSQIVLSFASTAPIASQLGGLAVFIVASIAFVLGGYRIAAALWLPRVTWLFLALAGLYVAGRIVPGGVIPVDNFFLRGATANSLFWVWTVCLASGQALYNTRLGNHWRLLLGLVAAGALYVGFFQARSWVSGWLPPALALVVTLWAGKPRLAVAAGGLAGLVLLFDQSLAARAFSALLAGENNYSAVTRLEAWRVMGEIVKISPVLGLGPANYYWYTPLFPILGWRVNFSSHNNYVDLVAQVGVVGLLCFLWFALSLTRLGLCLRKTALPGFQRAYLFGALGGLAGMLASGMLADWFLPFVYNIGLSGFRMSVLSWLFLGGIVSLARSTADSATASRA